MRASILDSARQDKRSEEAAKQSSRERFIGVVATPRGIGASEIAAKKRGAINASSVKSSPFSRFIRGTLIRLLAPRHRIGARTTFDSAHAPTTTPAPGPGRRQLKRPRRVTTEPPERELRFSSWNLCRHLIASKFSCVVLLGWLAVIVFSQSDISYSSMISRTHSRGKRTKVLNVEGKCADYSLSAGPQSSYFEITSFRSRALSLYHSLYHMFISYITIYLGYIMRRNVYIYIYIICNYFWRHYRLYRETHQLCRFFARYALFVNFVCTREMR